MSSPLLPDPDAPKDLVVSLTGPILVDLLCCDDAMISSAVDDRCCELYSDKSDEYAWIYTSRIYLVSKPSPILGSDMVPKICDFGLSKLLGPEKTSVVDKQRGYKPPEYVCTRVKRYFETGITKKCFDIYSLGMLSSHPKKDRISVDDDYNQDCRAKAMTSLDNFLHPRNPALQPDCFSYKSWATRYKIIKGICEGLNNEHMGIKHSIIHLDLKPSNIPVDRNMVPKIADFGLSRLLGHEKTSVIDKKLGYMPPEYFETGITKKCFDIYSLGIVILKTLSSHPKKDRISVDDDFSPDCMPNAMTSLDNFVHPWEPGLQPDWFSYMSRVTKYKKLKGICEGHNNENMRIKHSIIHRDLKPPNILLDDSMVPKISDFSLSKPLDANVGLSKTTVLGVRRYLSPEYIERGIAFKSDIYSLGVIITELLSSHPKKDRYMSWATKYKKIKGIFEGHNNKHMRIKRSIIHGALRPSNILLNHLDDNFVPKFTDSQILKLLCGDVEIPVSAAGTQNSLSDVDFTVAASAKGDTEIKIGYHVRHLLKYLGVHHPLFHMVLFAHKMFVDALKSMAPKGILDMAKRLSSSAVLNNVCKANWISAISELLKVETMDEYNTTKNVGSRKEVTENKTHHSVPDSCGVEYGIKEWKPKTPTAWVVSTAAPHHATGNRNILSGFVTEHDDQFVHALDGVPMKVLARGAVVTDAVVLPDVWFVPGLTANLVSVSQLAELGYSVRFDCGECYIRSAADGMIMGKAHLQEGGLYVLDFLKVSLAM